MLCARGQQDSPGPGRTRPRAVPHLTFDADYPQVRGNVCFSATQVAANPLGAMTRAVADQYPTRLRTP
ncbi:hypothetical protein NMG29_11795 [Streptomyces cocklensis]|uniref:Uncharacterized protein n=1 Tax=Actinacidiphila cocklensis TaxID=887465 RepID=A0A9W4E9L7_9ACTN|nr:hypothetical protein [Actinacidiphila cocklensis]MDD1058886.1 hypothetical protein [Actinacidiphila cocklensis]CAG6396466.1 hypothetical protein SCOCK_410043 [Actinacidiphila cocklensis]